MALKLADATFDRAGFKPLKFGAFFDQGSLYNSMDWKEEFDSIAAPSPNDQSVTVNLKIDPTVVQQMASQGWNSSLFAMFYNVAGKAPAVPNIGHHEKEELGRFPDHHSGVRRAKALFKGLQRPMNNDGDDEDVFVYVLNPAHVYKYVANMVCVAKRVPAPKNTVFLVYAVFEEDFSQGMIVNWEWVPCDNEQPGLPEDYETRYTTRIW